jgi:hypothetical protein
MSKKKLKTENSDEQIAYQSILINDNLEEINKNIKGIREGFVQEKVSYDMVRDMSDLLDSKTHKCINLEVSIKLISIFALIEFITILTLIGVYVS